MESVPRAVATGSRRHDPASGGLCDPVATALGTDLVTIDFQQRPQQHLSPVLNILWPREFFR